MKTDNIIKRARFRGRIRILVLLMMILVVRVAEAQIKIGGNIYGGGNAGDTGGSTCVTVRAGNIDGSVFGGARMANVVGSAFVNIDGENASSYILINQVYGGNDIAGTIGTSETLPASLTEVGSEEGKNDINISWNAFVRVSSVKTETTGEGGSATTNTINNKVYIGELFGGGNGAYTYSAQKTNGKFDVTIGETTYENVTKPELAKTYLEIVGGSIIWAFGGGNNVTVTNSSVICVDNPSEVVNSIEDDNGVNLLEDEDRIERMGVNPGYSYATSDAFQIGSFFGGNNLAPMAIRPVWNLKNGKIRNLYSGGNRGEMTSPVGLLLDIPATSAIKVDNVYGGCRMADVHPKNGNDDVLWEDIQLSGTQYRFPAGFSARVVISGGDINNVYGGNDISGRTYGGNAVGIRTSIRGDVYGGGNGSYPYTDNPALADDPTFGDLYYDPATVLSNAGVTADEGMESVTALNLFRPNAEQVSLRVAGTDEDHPTIIRGAIYVGGNSATLKAAPGKEARVELKIGSYVIADSVFLGNNGANMVANTKASDVLQMMNNTEIAGNSKKFNSIDLIDEDVFAKYMDGCAMTISPTVLFDGEDEADGDRVYKEYSSYFGSFFCGGNVGSMINSGKITIPFNHSVIIYDKLVGGCNNAYVAAKAGINAAYQGGVIGSEDERNGNYVENGKIKDRLELNLSGLKIQPMRMPIEGIDDNAAISGVNIPMVWNTIKVEADDQGNLVPVAWNDNVWAGDDITSRMNRRFLGGNIYGGCCTSGVVNGNVVINIKSTIVDRHTVFDEVEKDDETGEDNLYDNDNYVITEPRTGVILDQQGMDVLGMALNVFGGGKGKDTEIWGSTNINLERGYVFQIFGGSEEGAIGKKNVDGDYIYNKDYSTYVNLKGSKAGVSRRAEIQPDGSHELDEDMAEAEFLYGGGFEGPIAGNTHIILDNGRIFNSFAGSCNADILGHTETIVGQNGFPYVRDHIYGGNDLGGTIYGGEDNDFTSKFSEAMRGRMHKPALNLKAAAYTEYIKGRVDRIFAGCYGDYDYAGKYSGYTRPYMDNAMVNFKPVIDSRSSVNMIFGAGQGFTGSTSDDNAQDKMQDRSYVVIDIPQNTTLFSHTDVFGAGACCGIGMGVQPTKGTETDGNSVEENPDLASAVIDLFSGRIRDVYGASYEEGFTRRTVVNVPTQSTIHVDRLFGGGYGLRNTSPCDTYEAIVNYRSGDAITEGSVNDTFYDFKDNKTVTNATGIYGGNNNCRRTLYSKVNIYAPVYNGVVSKDGVKYTARVFGAGCGENTWSQYTEVNLNEGAQVYEVYGGGKAGRVLNWKSVGAWKTAAANLQTGAYQLYTEIGSGYKEKGLADPIVKKNGLRDTCNANVYINAGAVVDGYCYAGGLGPTATISGSAYIGLHGGTVRKDMYAGGTSGAIIDEYGIKTFVAKAYAYAESGMARNVYGGGWRGSVGYHDESTTATTDDILGESHVVVGRLNGTGYADGVPAINRNVYGGGEGGSIYGDAYVTINNGRIGYRYKNNNYVEELDDATDGDNLLDRSGNVFGGGYVANSFVDVSHVKMYGGIVRGGLYGGGEIGPIGRGTVKEGAASAPINNGPAKIYKAGETHVELYKGHVMRDVFGGGRGYDNWDGDGWMTDDEKETMDLSSKGFVFGSTDVRIYGGEVGTPEGVADGYGNVFGGGNVGFVYSATGTRQERTVPGTDGDKTYYYYDGNGQLTEDCSVLVVPYCQATEDVSIPSGGSYSAGDFVPNTDLDRLKNKNDASAKQIWDKLDLKGITIRNAVFAGGNVSVGDNVVYANTKTVLGNVSACVVDIFNRDLITIGTEHVGGIYGDGNLTLVDGYRELNITNYGTDYYGMSDNIPVEKYYELTDRERAYFALEYRCINGYSVTTDAGTKTYQVGERITAEVYNALDEAYKENWQLWGFCSIYAGRLMNTIQRADFCGIFGSRLVLQGAKDRVPSVADKTDYTVNRVGEVSLNQVNTIAGESDEDAKHGNYFGIYSIVNYMGALTSDVNFYTTPRTTDNSNYAADGTTTFYQWKEANPKERKRNNGTSPNRVALASGVYLELTTEKSTDDNKDWGYITGVAQLELINVKAGLGGGYVYAKNEHGVRKSSGNDHTILSSYNMASISHARAVTNKIFEYSSSDLKEVQTSGNFVHNVKQIIDDCYPTSNSYSGANAAPAHYWFIRGTSYVYDQYITAYTGVSNAYSKTQKIPLNINAASYGKMKLEDVKVNLYAYYYSTEVDPDARTPLQNTDENAAAYSVIVNNDVTYHLNDSISYWDWMQLSEVDQRHFVADTYLTIAECKIGDVTYPEGTVILPSKYNTLKAASHKVIDGKDVYLVHHVAKDEDVDFDYVFRRSNNLSHHLGYVLTYSVDNPGAWNVQDPDCTYSPSTTGVYGQHYYNEGEIIDKTTYDDYESMGDKKPADTEERKQAKMAEAYVTTEDLEFTDGDNHYKYIAGTPLCQEDYSAAAWTNSISSKVELAKVCTGTIEFDGVYAPKSLLFGEVVTTARYNEVVAIYKDVYGVSKTQAETEVSNLLSKAYICYDEGYYGGGYFETGGKYSALKAWSSLSPEDRDYFSFNYDAFNLLIDPTYSGIQSNGLCSQYDNNQDPYTYSKVQPIDYKAQYVGDESLSYKDNDGAQKTIAVNAVIGREQYENIPNEQYHYSPIKVTDTKVYVVNTPFARGDTPYTVGQTIPAETYGYLADDQKEHVTVLTFDSSDLNETFYYCREDYTISNDDNGHAVIDVITSTTINKGGNVRPGVLIDSNNYDELSNLQHDFIIQGDAPEELTTLYVAAQSDIFDLQKDRIITVIYSYEYTESDESGTHIEPISERHIINIHIHFESGVPTISTLHSPPPALPGDFVSLIQPSVKPGAYELMGGGWEIFENEEDAERHRNGVEFSNKTPVYWYQDGQYVAYYAKTYLGKTYSNHVPFSVANYHDLKAVMSDKDYHLHVDHPGVKRDCKIYINDYSADDKNGLDLLKDLYDLSVTTTTYDEDGHAKKFSEGPFAGHTGLNNTGANGVQGCQNIELFLHTDLAPKAYANSWQPLGSSQCFNGILHGEGHTVSELSNSLFDRLCGNVYNLGVTGTFTTAGLANTGSGHVENCWVKSAVNVSSSVKAVFGAPDNDSQVVNCYYPESNAYASGSARAMTKQQFSTGEVAYNLNGFYLKERYNRQAAEADKINTGNYIENRYKSRVNSNDIDFLYAGGTIPTEDDIRLKTDENGYYYEPIWPDDYIFFGQILSYGYSTSRPHQYVPAYVAKADGLLAQNSQSNRVCRAPAYFGNSVKKVAHFNIDANLTAYFKSVAVDKDNAYPGMTAIDLKGHDDTDYTKGLNGGLFFEPLLDDDGLININLKDETANLLVYAPSENDNPKTFGVLKGYFTEPPCVESDEGYRCVTVPSQSISGHLVLSNKKAANDHLLVDLNDFNCPIPYDMGDYRMWYQRIPAVKKYVTLESGKTKGWEDICLPFTAELVTTPDKGEITHFYDGSNTGHEYWLREYDGIEGSSSGSEVPAKFKYPEVYNWPSGEGKEYTNTFLYDHYYSVNGSKDHNEDIYQIEDEDELRHDYYSSAYLSLLYPDNQYPLFQAATPYLVGFPGSTYYEFDLSGSFEAENTFNDRSISKIDAQPIIFVSDVGTPIRKSDLDEELGENYKFDLNGYAYCIAYSSRPLAANVSFLLNGDGNKYVKQTAETTTTIPFRPYFVRTSSESRGVENGIDSIIFSNEPSKPQATLITPVNTVEDLLVKAARKKIVVESILKEEADVRIVTPAGITLTSYSIEPGETVETRIEIGGVYIVYAAGGKYVKKVIVK